MLPPLAEIFTVVPLNVKQWLIVMGLSFVPVVFSEIEKAVFRK